MPDAPLADPGVRNYRSGLLRTARRWNFDHDWTLIELDVSYGVRMVLSRLRPWFLEDLGRRDFPPFPCFMKRGPVVAAPLAATVEPFMNQSLGVPDVVPEAFGIADHTVVIPSALQLALERGDDLGKREASRFLKPLLECC